MSLPSAFFITGASSGFGRELALDLLSRGIPVVATARKVGTLDELVKKGAMAMQFDVNASEDVLGQKAKEADGLVEGGIAVLINNAGFSTYGSCEEQRCAAFPLSLSLCPCFDRFGTCFNF